MSGCFECIPDTCVIVFMLLLSLQNILIRYNFHFYGHLIRYLMDLKFSFNTFQ